MITTLLPNHATAIYKEMTGLIEQRVIEFDLRRWVGQLYQRAIDVEFEHFMGLDRYIRDPQRRDYRNGFYQRSLDTVYGWVEGIRIPRARNEIFRPRVIGRYKRREEIINKLIAECYWRGISTRDMKHILKALSNIEVSSSSVSRLTAEFQQEVFRWHQRPISDEYVYLFLDGVWIKNRSIGQKRRLVLVAFGIKKDGTKEVIDYQLSMTEKEEHWVRFLTWLSHRGLKGKNLKLIITDGCHGLWNAVDMVFPDLKHQTCWAHKMRNILDKVKKAEQEAVHKDLKELFDPKTDTNQKAQKIVNLWKKKWRRKYPRAVRSLEYCEERLFNYLDCPKEHHKAIRTTNHIERVFREFRRRMRSQEITPNKHSADRMLYALTQRRNEALRSYPVKFTQ